MALTLSLSVWLACGVSCSPEPQVVPLSITSPDHADSLALGQQVQSGAGDVIGVRAFRDGRREHRVLGTRLGRWGILDTCIFTVKEGDLGNAVAEALSRSLKTMGWKTRIVEEREPAPPDLLVTGEIVELQVNARSNLFSTHVDASVIILLERKDPATGKLVSMKLTGSGSENVFWFQPQDAETVLHTALTSAFQQWLPRVQTVGNRLG